MTLVDVWAHREKHERIAMYFAGNKMLADDVLSDFYLKVDKKAKKDGNMNFLSYNGKINDSYTFLMIRSCFYDIIRKEVKYSDTPPPRNITHREESEPLILDHHLKGLSWYEKKLTEVYFEEGHSIRSLAKATNISTTNIFTTLKKTKSQIENSINMEIDNEIQKHVGSAREAAGIKPKRKSTKAKPRADSPYMKAKQKKEEKLQAAKAMGLGDTIENITKAAGIKKVVDKVFGKLGKDCGCDKRKELLNKIFPYRKTTCMNKEQFIIWTETKSHFKTNVINSKELKKIALLHSQLFNHRYSEPCRCTPKIWAAWIREIDKIYHTYKDDATKAL